MPYIPNTPESLLRRSDSKDPATTCQGITTSGRRCRNTVRATPSAQSSPSPSPLRAAVTRKTVQHVSVIEGAPGRVALYCWQHIDQAATSTAVSQGRSGAVQLGGRSSIDSIVERFSLLDVDEEAVVQGKRSSERRGRSETAALQQDPRLTQHVHRRSISVPEKGPTAKSRHRPGMASRRRSTSTWKFSCFSLQLADEDDIPPSKPSGSPGQATPRSRTSVSRENRRQRGSASTQLASEPRTPERPRSSAVPLPRSPPQFHTPTRSLLPDTSNMSLSQTQLLLEPIPVTLSPGTFLSLFRELAESISKPGKAGFIYIFRATPGAAPSTPPSPNDPNDSAHTRDVTRSPRAIPPKVDDSPTGTRADTVLVKIGGTDNVQRRLNEWKRCMPDLAIIRCYPYTPSSDKSYGSPRMVPKVFLVERLIHLELADSRFKPMEPCEGCGKRHRELFEVKREQLRLVHECAKRWVSWAQRYYAEHPSPESSE